MRIGSLFSGYGGLDMGVRAALGGEVAWHSEVDKAASAILAHHWPDVPNLGDVTAVDWSQVEPVDVLYGGFPCQDVSHAGKRKGLGPDTRSGLWEHMARAVTVLRPRLVVIENVRGLLSVRAHSDMEPCPWCLGDEPDVTALRALGAVLGDLAELRYDTRWVGLRAADAGAPHGRFRVFIVASPTADPDGERHGRREDARSLGRVDGEDAGQAWQRERARQVPSDRGDAAAGSGKVDWGQYAPAITRWEHTLGRPAPAPTEPGRNGQPRLAPAFVEWLMGLPTGHVTAVPGLSRNDQLKALGNGVVPQQAALALRLLLGRRAAA